MKRKYKPIKIEQTDKYTCDICGGQGTVRIIHCGQLMRVTPVAKDIPEESKS